MSDMTCLHCGATTTNGLALCEACQMRVAICLEFLPIYFRNLARWRPGRAGSRPVPSSRIPSGVFPAAVDPVSGALDEVGSDLSTWARALEDDRGVEMPAAEGEGSVVRVLCLTFASNLTSIATLEWAGEFVHRIGEHEERLSKLTRKVAPGWYAGSCQQTVGTDEEGDPAKCGHPTHVIPGMTWVTCGVCGATTYARDHLETVLDEARGWIDRPRRLAEAIVALVDTELSVPRLHDRIRQWEVRDKVTAGRRLDADGDATGPKRYRLGDVLDLIAREGETRSRVARAKAS